MRHRCARSGRCSRCSCAASGASTTCTSARCTRPTRRWRCTTPGTSTPAATRASASGSSRRPTSPRPARTRRTPSSRRPATRSTGTPRSTTSPTTSRTCEGGPIPMTDDEFTAYQALANETDDHRWAFGTGFTDPLEGIDTSVPAGVNADALAAYGLMLGDDALIYSHRLPQWMTRLPELEEETAMANISLELLGQARMLLARAGRAESAGRADGTGRDEDELAFFRDEHEFRNVRLVEALDADFAELAGRLLIFSTWRLALLSRLAD